jgi:hypothetical protein
VVAIAASTRSAVFAAAESVVAWAVARCAVIVTGLAGAFAPAPVAVVVTGLMLITLFGAGRWTASVRALASR